MSIGQFLSIFWARRILIIAAAASCLIGALIVAAILPPSWASTARVMLDTIKPDPVTGQVMGNAARGYVATQVELITDYSVASRVADQVGWLTDPALIKAYRKRPADDQRDYRSWLADIVIDHTKAKLIEDSNILEVKYTGPTAQGAKAAADALIKAYMGAILESRHVYAEQNAAWYVNQTAKAKQALDEAVAAETAFERANGVVMSGDRTDSEDARLQSLTVQTPSLLNPLTPTEGSAANMELAQVEAQLTAAEKTFGPNSPQILDLQAKRASLAALAQRERAAAREADARVAAGGAREFNRELAAQKAKVISDSEKIGRLNQLHQNVELRREEYNRAAQRAAEFRQQSESADTGVTPLGPATTPKQPAFPNYVLIVPGSIMLGLGVGVGVSLLLELLSRKVRATEDLVFNEDVPLICLVPAPDTDMTKRPASGGGVWRWRWGARASGAVGA